MAMRTRAWLAIVIGVMACFGVVVTSAQDPVSPATPVAADAGAAMFKAYCATCHGDDAHGMGPTALARHRMPDLTQLAARNGGRFPSERVFKIIDGRDVSAHGTPEMPVWGRVFQRQRNLDAAAVKQQIDALVKYLEKIQQRAG